VARERERKDWVEQITGWRVEERLKVLHRRKYYWVPNAIPPDQIDGSLYAPSLGFAVVPRRWAVERMGAWFSQNLRLSSDAERLCATSEAWVYLSMMRLMLKHLAHESVQPAFHYRHVA
jgi:hypothetical protein